MLSSRFPLPQYSEDPFAKSPAILETAATWTSTSLGLCVGSTLALRVGFEGWGTGFLRLPHVSVFLFKRKVFLGIEAYQVRPAVLEKGTPKDTVPPLPAAL